MSSQTKYRFVDVDGAEVEVATVREYEPEKLVTVEAYSAAGIMDSVTVPEHLAKKAADMMEGLLADANMEIGHVETHDSGLERVVITATIDRPVVEEPEAEGAAAETDEPAEEPAAATA